MKPAHELLYDSEASLRLVDRAIGDLNSPPPQATSPDSLARPALRQVLEQPADQLAQARALLDEYADTAALIIRFCQGTGMLDARGNDAFQHMPGRLRDVASRTETATTDILDGLARAVSLVNTLDQPAPVSDDARRTITASLRDELNSVTHHLQFQDITAQQLGEIASHCSDVRNRIAQVVSIFGTPPSTPALPISSSRAASDDGQALADEIFALQLTLKAG